MIQQWEYLVSRVNGIDPEMVQAVLNNDGKHGWELVNAVQVIKTPHVHELMLFLKRPKTDER